MGPRAFAAALLLWGVLAPADDLGDMPDVRKMQRTPQVRTMDGSENNPARPRSHWGTADSLLLRQTTPCYADGAGTPAGGHRPGARVVSNAVAAQAANRPNARGASDFIWQWGQFLDHDLDLSVGGIPGEPMPIPVPAGDPWFDPEGTGEKTLPFVRSDYRVVDGVREQVNTITAYIDGSQVYGSDPTRAQALRALDGTGRLKTSAGDLLPFNADRLPNAPSDAPEFFVGGDVRANENLGLLTLHVLFVREHNALALEIHERHPELSDDEIYECARTIVGAELQAITYGEYLPILLGAGALPEYLGYRAPTNPGIDNAFSTAAFRFGHSALSPQLLRLNEYLQPIPEGPLPLKNAFFAPHRIHEGGLEPILRGLARQRAQEIDNRIVDGVRNFLFGPPGSGGQDLASLNIQRGRDHGLPDYNQARREYGLEPVASFDEISSDPGVVRALRSVYASVGDVDLWVGGLAEDHVEGAMLGELFRTILIDQFRRLRDADRFWYRRCLHRDWVEWVESQTLADVIRRNTSIGPELQDDVFFAPGE